MSSASDSTGSGGFGSVLEAGFEGFGVSEVCHTYS